MEPTAALSQSESTPQPESTTIAYGVFSNEKQEVCIAIQTLTDIVCARVNGMAVVSVTEGTEMPFSDETVELAENKIRELIKKL